MELYQTIMEWIVKIVLGVACLAGMAACIIDIILISRK